MTLKRSQTPDPIILEDLMSKSVKNKHLILRLITPINEKLNNSNLSMSYNPLEKLSILWASPPRYKREKGS